MLMGVTVTMSKATNKSVRLRGPLKYVGGKSYLAKEIINLLDYSVQCYVEPFFGAGHVFFQKQPHKVEIINDIDNDLINFYLVWKEQKDRLIQELEYIPYSGALRKQWLEEWLHGHKGKDDFERAVRYFFLIRSGFDGLLKSSFSVSFVKNSARAYYGAIKLIDLMYERIKNAQILNRDFRNVLERIENRKCMIYADPPYFGHEKYYSGNFSKQDHEDLARIFNSLPNAKIIVSYYYFDGIEQLYPKDKWKYIEIQQTKHSVYSITTRPYAPELLILNYEPTKNICHTFSDEHEQEVK